MSDIQPKGISVKVDGRDWHFYLTIAAADVIQDHYDLPLQEVMNKLFTERERYGIIAYVVSVLTADEVRRSKLKIKAPTEAQLRDVLDVPAANRLVSDVLQAYGISMPKKDDDEDDDPNSTRRNRRS